MAFIKQEKPKGIRAAKRGIWYFMRTTLIAVALVALCAGVFITAARMTNLYILATEGLQLRAQCILADGALLDLEEYFTLAFIEEDPGLLQNPYLDYTIKSYDYRVEVESISVWPWSTHASVTVVDRMAALNGTILEDKKTAGAPEDAAYPVPKWESARYLLRFRLRDDRWYIYQIQLVDAAPTMAPKPTPDMRITPIPAVTPTPSASPAVTPSTSPSAQP